MAAFPAIGLNYEPRDLVLIVIILLLSISTNCRMTQKTETTVATDQKAPSKRTILLLFIGGQLRSICMPILLSVCSTNNSTSRGV